MHDEDAGINDGRTYKRNVVQHVGRLLHTGLCIDIASEGSSDALKIVEDCLAGEILGSVEAHVLKEMRKSVLVRSFLDGTDIGSKIKLSAVCRLAVLHDVIGHAVLQFSLSDGRIIWQLLVHLRIRRKCESCEHCSENQNEFSHIQ